MGCKLGFPREGAVKGYEIEIGKIGRRPRQIGGVTIFLDEEPRQALMNAHIFDPMPAQHIE